MQAAAMILAAGSGSRMKSAKPKVVHEILSKPLVRWVIESAHAAGITRIATIVGHCRQQVIPLVSQDTTIVVQEHQNGTADAVMSGKNAFADFEGSLVILSGDCPLISPSTISKLIAVREEQDAAAVVLTMDLENPFGYGRIIRNEAGEVTGIVEQKDANEAQKLITECNSGFYCFDAKVLFAALTKVGSNNAQGEFYLTDVLAICRAEGRKVMGLRTDDPTECLGINTRIQLAEASAIMRDRVNGWFMNEGITIVDPKTTWIDPTVTIGNDTVILPCTTLMGQTIIGHDCVIGPNTFLKDVQVPDNAIVRKPTL